MCSTGVPELGATHSEPSFDSPEGLPDTRLHTAEGEPAAGELRVSIWRPSNDLCVLSLAGEMDMSNASELTRALGGNVGSGQLILELSRLTFMDSTGVRQFAELSRTVKAAGGTIALAAPHPNLRRLFEIVNLGEIMPIAETLETAIDRTSQTDAAPELEQEDQAIASTGRDRPTTEG